ncbi:hypothetical protein PsorP6_015706 [Peronosclerospora sorghi]|uniref:Uncharacterized protein n=1 Tax=Peronosclerospora sorghi TaxID=230839 RepID=A0ACC0WR65_9STRA|nr:hypothetical protein PsorP6_015706 [Peronosclerospora sorghi]
MPWARPFRRSQTPASTKCVRKTRGKTSIQPNGKYYATRNQYAIVAFALGGKYQRGNGFHFNGSTHTDRPWLKFKPVSNIESQGSFQVGVETYGRVIVRERDTSFQSKLRLRNRPILRIPTLAIHLVRNVGEGLKFKNETHLRPVLALAARAELEITTDGKDENNSKHASVLLPASCQGATCQD